MSHDSKKRFPYFFPRWNGSILFIAAFLIICPWVNGRADDMPNATDHSLLKRFEGSKIVGYDVKQFDTYELQSSTYKKCDLSSYQRQFARPPLKLEGRLTRLWYESAGETSSTEIMRNYQNELAAQGFQILYDSQKDPEAVTWTNFLAPFGRMSIQTNRGYYIFFAANRKGIRTTSAKLERPEGNVYVYLVAVEWGKDDTTYKARKGAYISVDILEEQAMTQHMVVVPADEMSRSITSAGRVALYGILFDTDKADIQPESKPALDEIAILLKQEPNLKLHVVGHTDNVGGYEYNLDLSKRRAQSVVDALTRQHGIAADRLTANGVAYLAPVAVNTSDAGRAKNRRVELVPR